MRELRETHPVPIVLLTGRMSTADVTEGLDSGADDHITQPFHPTAGQDGDRRRRSTVNAPTADAEQAS
jgi:CheY-like chemotaxis protein